MTWLVSIPITLDESAFPLVNVQCLGQEMILNGAEGVCMTFCRGKNVARNIASALAFMHKKGVCHLDVKSANILLSTNNVAKLGSSPPPPPPSCPPSLQWSLSLKDDLPVGWVLDCLNTHYLPETHHGNLSIKQKEENQLPCLLLIRAPVPSENLTMTQKHLFQSNYNLPR